MYILIKGREDKPPNPRILVGDEEMKLSKWANRKAAEMMRAEDKPASGPEWEARRNSLIEQVKVNPDEHGISFLGGVPEGFSEGGPREATDIPQPEPVARQDTASVGETSLQKPSVVSPSEDKGEEDEEPKKDPQQSSLFDFGMKMKSNAMGHAWDYLNR